jgi:hypothetical protein
MLLDNTFDFVDIFGNTSRENPGYRYDYFTLLPIFEEIKFELFPTFKYLQGNCHCVAHFASLMLESQHLNHEKVWIFAPCKYDETSNDVIQVMDKNQLAPSGFVRWGYHVANVVYENDKKWIFDFGIDPTKPLLLEDWLGLFAVSNFRVEFQDWRHYLFFTKEIKKNGRQKKSIFNGNYFAYAGKCHENNWLEKGLALNETAYQFFTDEFIGLENPQLKAAYKLMVGSINTFESLIENRPVHPRLPQKLLLEHSALIEKYQKTYAKNLEFWKLKVASYF